MTWTLSLHQTLPATSVLRSWPASTRASLTTTQVRILCVIYSPEISHIHVRNTNFYGFLVWTTPVHYVLFKYEDFIDRIFTDHRALGQRLMKSLC